MIQRPDIPVQTIQTQPWEVDDFRGGVTDYPIGAETTKSERMDNLVLVPHGEKAKPFTRQGSEIYDETYYQIPAGNQRIGTLKTFEDTLLVHSKEKLQYIASGWQTLTGPSGNQVFPSTATTSDVVSMATWNRHLLVTSSGFFRPQKVYPNASGTLTLRTAGLPALASSPVVTPGTAGSSYNTIYAFIYSYDYTVDTVNHQDLGPVTYVVVAAGAAPNASTFAITVIPALANGATHNYDTASSSLKVKIYRTTNAGATFYYVGSVNNGTTTFNDTVADTTLVSSGVLLYTEGGVLENDPPLPSKLVHVTGDIAYYAHVKDGTEVFSNRLMQAVPGDADSVPADNYTDVEGEIVGLSSVKGAPILLCKGGEVYRVDGVFDDFGRGGMFPQKISDATDCISSQSVVQTMEGVFWAGTDGIYFTDGYQVLRLNEDYDKTWADWVLSSEQRSRIQGKYDSKKRRIWWTIQETGEVDCNRCYILDLNWGIRPKATFTTASGTNDSFAPTALEFSGGEMVRGDRRGYLFLHQDGVYTDPKVDTLLTPPDWETTLLQYDYLSAGFNFGTSFERKFVPRMDITCENETNLSLQILSVNDNNPASYELKPIRSRGNMVWGDADIIWGDPDLLWNSQTLIDEWRRFPAGTLRCEYKQIQLTNAWVAIVSSDVLGTATVSVSGSTATLTDASTVDWPTTIVDYAIAFETDGYVREYEITGRTSADVITFSDPSGSAPNAAGVAWVVRGYPRGEILNLLAYTIHFSVFGKTQGTYRSSGSGEVGA